MKKRLFTLFVTASFLSIVKPAFAATPTINNTDQELQKVAAQTAALETEVNTLTKEIHQLKAEQGHLKKTTRIIRTEEQQRPVKSHNPVHILTPTTEESHLLPAIRHSPVMYLTGTPVVIAPYIGEHNAFNALDLVVNYSSYNLDLNLLKLRQHMDQQYTDACLPVPNSPMLMLSGKVEGQGIYSSPYNGAYSTSKIDLSSAELDVIPTIGPWASGYAAFTYDNSPVPNTPLVANSRVFVKRAFLTFGNLNRFPIYMTVGQFDVPFSDYGTYMISSVLASNIFQTRARALLVGYQGASGQGPYARVFAFNGDSNTHHNNNINNVGASAGYSFSQGIYSGELGMSGIANVADSLSMQSTGAPTGFQGFSAAVPFRTTEVLQRQVPGAAIHANVGIGPFGGMARYVEATSAFNTQDMMFNGRGARPQALDVEAFYNFHVFSKPTVFSVAYDKSWEALALGVPEHRYMATLLTSIWKDTIEQIEFRHDVNYGVGDTASGARISTPASAKGGVSNTVTAQVGIYF